MDLPEGAPEVLAQPTRARLFSLLGELKRPAGTSELADLLRLHPNGVRVHLERLHGAGLVSRTRPPRPRGRPRDEWSVSPEAQPLGDPPSAYRDLVRWLARAIKPRPASLREVESAGREIGRSLAPREGVPAEGAMRAALSALGFRPELNVARDGTLTCTLGNCPYREAVRENPEVVCGLHRGMTRGLLDVVAERGRLTRFVPRDPDLAGCLIEARGVEHHAPAEKKAPE